MARAVPNSACTAGTTTTTAHIGTLPMAQIKRGVQTGQVQLGEILLSAYANEDPFFEVDGVPFLAWTWPQAEALQTVGELPGTRGAHHVRSHHEGAQHTAHHRERGAHGHEHHTGVRAQPAEDEKHRPDRRPAQGR